MYLTNFDVCTASGLYIGGAMLRYSSRALLDASGRLRFICVMLV